MTILKYTLIAVAAGMALTTIATVMTPDKPCPPIQAAAFWVPDDRLDDLWHLLAKAERLNSSGQCAIEGGWGNAYQRYYIAVYPSGNAKRALNMRFTRAELDQ